MPKKTCLSFLLLLSCAAGWSQSFPSDSALTRILKSDVLLPMLIDSAIRNSAEYKRMGQNVAMYEQNLQTAKKSILNTVVLNSTYGYGNAGSIALEKDPTIINPYLQSSNVKTSRINVGVSVQVPLGNFLSRKNTVRNANIQVEMAESEKEAAELFIRQQVIRMYQDLKLAHAMLLTTGKMYQSSNISVSLSQKAFADGQVSLDQFTKLQNEAGQNQLLHETQVNRFQTAFLLLEDYAGIRLTKLIMAIR